jgi:nucleoside-diphosphate-sugar epimerase
VKVVVTGASGFLGAESVRQLRAAGHDVITVDQSGSPDIRIDLADERAVRRLPDANAVVHSAAVQYVSADLPLVRRAAYFHRNNVAATRNLAARYTGRGAHFVNIGTSMMYGQTGQEVYGIHCPWREQGLYTASKIEAQRSVERMPNPTACVIPCIIAGEGRGGLFASLVGTMRRWRVAVWPGRGRHRVHLVHVRDAASLIVAVLERRATGRFNAASPRPLTIVQWVDEISSVLQLDPVRRIALPLAPVALAAAASGYRLFAQEQLLMLRMPHVLAVDESLALGWRPRYTNAQIVRETAAALARAE